MARNFPIELTKLRQWVNYRITERDNGKAGKPPVDPMTGMLAKADDPSTWGTFDQAMWRWRNIKDVNGISFMFSKDDPYFGVDLDDAIHPDGTLDPIAADIVKRLNSFTEISQSGTGLHIIAKYEGDELMKEVGNGRRNKETRAEMYLTNHSFVMTGNIFGEAKQIQTRTKEGHEVFMKYVQRETVQSVPAAHRPGVDQVDDELDWNATITDDGCDPSKGYCMSKNLTDAELWEKMFESPKVGYEVKSLYDGDISIRGNDHSAADWGLICYLKWWTYGDPVRMDRMFRQSGLMRPKWDEMRGNQTYGQKTIDGVLYGKKKKVKNNK